MSKLENLQKALQKVDYDSILNDVLKDTNTPEELVKKRLNEKGERSTGVKIKTKRAHRGVYANATIFIKMRKGQPYDRVTLKDTGDFHKSIEKKLLKDAFNLEGDSEKPDGNIEDNVDLTNVLNLSDDELTELVKEIRPDYIQKIRNTIGI